MAGWRDQSSHDTNDGISSPSFTDSFFALGLLLSFDEGGSLEFFLLHVVGTGCLYMMLQSMSFTLSKEK